MSVAGGLRLGCVIVMVAVVFVVTMITVTFFIVTVMQLLVQFRQVFDLFAGHQQRVRVANP